MLKEFVRNRKRVFSAVPTMTRALENVLGKVENDIERGKNMTPIFSSAEKANEYLDTLWKSHFIKIFEKQYKKFPDKIRQSKKRKTYCLKRPIQSDIK